MAVRGRRLGERAQCLGRRAGVAAPSGWAWSACRHDLQVLASPWVLGVAAILFALNFFADKIP